MRKFAIAMAVVLGLNFASAILNHLVPVSFAQESPSPEPEKPEKPSE